MFYHVFECVEIGCCTVTHQTLQYENIYSAELCNSALDNLDCVKKYLPIQKKNVGHILLMLHHGSNLVILS